MKLTHIVIILLSLIIIILACYFPFTPSNASSSPSFEHQEVLDKRHNWKFFSVDNKANCTGIEHSVQVPDMEAVSYLSDGNS